MGATDDGVTRLIKLHMADIKARMKCRWKRVPRYDSRPRVSLHGMPFFLPPRLWGTWPQA